MLRTRDNTVANRENANIRVGKDALIKPAVGGKPSRPALGEVGNKLLQQRNRAIKPTTTTTAICVKKPQLIREDVIKKENTSEPALTIKSPAQKIAPIRPVSVKKCDKVVAYSTKQLDVVEEQSEKGDPLLLVEYVQDIYGYLRDLEVQYAIRPNFLENHKSSPRMRSILIDWLVEAHRDFAYLLETLHLAVSLVDRYLQTDKTVDRNNLQLVGLSALWIAAKYEEMYVASLQDFVYLADNAFTEIDMVRMEQKILVGIEWALGRPLAIHFLKRYSKLAKVQPKEYVLGKYLLEIALMQHDLCHIKPSLLAAAAVCLSVGILNDLNNPNEMWTDDLAKRVCYTYAELKETVNQLAYYLLKQETSKYQNVRKKYAETKLQKISLHPKLSCSMVKMLASRVAKKP